MISKEIENTILNLSSAMDNNDEWIRFKRLLLISLHPSVRSKFSRRDDITKKQKSLNEFEKKILEHYENTTGKKLRVEI